MYGINDPSALLRPWKDLKQFTEELYAMFTQNADVASQQVKPAVKAISFDGQATESSAEGDSQVPSFGSVRSSRISEARQKVTIPEQSRPSSHAPSAYQPPPPVEPSGVRPYSPTSAPLGTEFLEVGAMILPEFTTPSGQSFYSGEFTPDSAVQTFGIPDLGDLHLAGVFGEVDAAGIIVDSMSHPIVGHGFGESFGFEPKYPDAVVGPLDLEGFKDIDPGAPLPFVPDGGSGTSTFIGKIISGGGKTYQVQLFPDGMSGDPGDAVGVDIPILADGENLPVDSWITPIIQAGDFYYYQPPVWMD